MEWHWWERSWPRPHVVGVGKGMLRSLQEEGWWSCQCQGPPSSVCCSKRSWARHSHGYSGGTQYWFTGKESNLDFVVVEMIIYWPFLVFILSVFCSPILQFGPFICHIWKWLIYCNWMVRFVNVYHSPFKFLWAPLDCNSSTTPELDVPTSGYQMYGRMALACEISYSCAVVSYFIP